MSVFDKNVALSVYLRDVLHACPVCVMRLIGAPAASFSVTSTQILASQLHELPSVYEDEHAHLMTDPLEALLMAPPSTCNICLGLYDRVIQLLSSTLASSLAPYSNYATYKPHVSVPMLCSLRDAYLFSHLAQETLPLWAAGVSLTLDNAIAATKRMESTASKGTKVGGLHHIANMGPLHEMISTREALTMICEAFLTEVFQPESSSRFDLDIRIETIFMYSGPKTVLGLRCTRKNKMSGKKIVDALSTYDIASLGSEDWAKIPFVVNEAQFGGATLEVEGVAVSFAGRYLKKARNIPQSPWFIGGREEADRKGVGSVEEFIEEALREYLPSAGGHTFIPSGREDRNVRMMGNGRPFVLIFRDVKAPIKAFDDAQRVSARVKELSHGAVEALHLCLATPQVIKATKDPCHRKSYRAVVRVLGDNAPSQQQREQLDRQLASLCESGGVQISQWTPVRVLHRRALIARGRHVFTLAVERWAEEGRLCVVHLSTEAGTYIKEFIHGDLGRTTPSFSHFLGFPVDILSLDVAGVHRLDQL